MADIQRWVIRWKIANICYVIFEEHKIIMYYNKVKYEQMKNGII